METSFNPQWLVLAGVAVLFLVALLFGIAYQRRQSQERQQRFGPQHGQEIADMRNRTRAEAERNARAQGATMPPGGVR